MFNLFIFFHFQLSSSYYVYQVAKKLQGAEKILLCMGYEPVSGSANEIQELKYGGEVNTGRVVYTAADLVILHSELDHIRDLVTGAIQSKYVNVTLQDILKARSDPNDTLSTTLQRSLACSLVRITNLRQAQLSQAPAIPPRGLVPQRLQSAQLQPPAVQGQPISLQHRQDNQNLLPNGRRSSAPDVQTGISDRQWHQPPPSPLLQQSTPPVQQRNTPIIPPNSKDSYNLDKTIDKSQGKGIDSVKYNVVSDPGSPVAKDASIPFDPLNLPEPAFDPHDLEIFHQEACNLEDPYTSSNMSLLINPRSDDLGDFSGPNLDDHLAYRSHDSGHIGLSESSTGSALGKSAEEKSESEQQQREEESEYDDDTCTSGIQFGIVSAQRVEDVKYELVDLQKNSQSSGGQDTSFDSQPPTIYSQSTQQTPPPVVRPRSKSGGEKELKQRNDGSLPSKTSTDTERPPIPKPRSDNNLPSMKGPPNSPDRSKPAVIPRKINPRNKKSNESSKISAVQTVIKDISAEDENAAVDVCISQPLPEIQESLIIIDDGAPTCTSHVTSMDSNSSDNLHSEAHNSLDSGSPHPSLESKPSISNKPDPCSSTPPEKARSAYSGEKVEFEERSEGSWTTIDFKDSQDAPTGLDTQPRPRERSAAFSTKSDKTATDKSKKPKGTRIDDTNTHTANLIADVHTDLQKAKPCWYCTNLTSLAICDVCGNPQRLETAV